MADFEQLTESDIERMKQRSGRNCGSCSMCCHVLDIDDPELVKPQDEWCRHCKPGKGGCSIYSKRPDICRGFACWWLIDPTMTDAWYPKRARIVVHFQTDEDTPHLQFAVDSKFPNRWREQPYFNAIKQMCGEGLRGDRGGIFRTSVVVGNDTWLILPHREIRNSGPGVFIQPGIDRFEFVQTESVDAAKMLVIAMKSMRDFGSFEKWIEWTEREHPEWQQLFNDVGRTVRMGNAA